MNNYTLNKIGQAAMRRAVFGMDKRYLTADAYFSAAEGAANEAFDDELDAVIEIRAMHSVSGNPETINLDRSWFDAETID